jgi:hypothetical protein
MTTRRTKPCNVIGISLVGKPNERLHRLVVYQDSDTVIVDARVVSPRDQAIVEAIQYLTPIEAMAFARAFERCAVAALRVVGDDP